MNTEDALLPLVMDMLNAVPWPVSAQNPRGVQVLFGAYNAAPGVELVGVTGQTQVVVEPNREETITFHVATLVNIPGMDEAATWQRRSEITEAIVETLVDLKGTAYLSDEIRALGVYHWRITERKTAVEPAADAVPGASGWVGYSLLTVDVAARPNR